MTGPGCCNNHVTLSILTSEVTETQWPNTESVLKYKLYSFFRMWAEKSRRIVTQAVISNLLTNPLIFVVTASRMCSNWYGSCFWTQREDIINFLLLGRYVYIEIWDSYLWTGDLIALSSHNASSVLTLLLSSNINPPFHLFLSQPSKALLRM